MSTISDVKPNAAELHERMGPAMYREAYARGMSLSAYLEQIDPSAEYKDGLDAFGRQMKMAGIRSANIPEHGVWADEFGAFEKSDQARALAPEWIARQWRRALYSTTRGASPAVYQGYDSILGSWANSYVDDPTPRDSAVISPAIPLARLTALTTPISGDAYRSYYLTVDAAQLHMARVTEGAEVPRAKLTGGERTIRLQKFGRSLEATYEALRRQRLPRIAKHIQLLAAQSEVDKVTVALDTLISGDGNANTAATSYNLTALDTGTVAGTLTVKGWLAFKMKFANPYSVDTILAQEDVALKVMMLNMGSANVPLVTVAGVSGFGGFTQINPGLRDNVALGWGSAFPANKIVGVDTRMALEQVIEIGADIREIERWTTRQVEVLTMTEVNGFAVFDASATKVLNLAA